MGERRGLKALELWCRRVTEGYRDVRVVDMSSSWRDGLAFCALIHHFRPDLIEFDSLRKEDVLGNNRLAFSVAEAQLGIPALLDAEDMLAHREPDRLSVATYVSQFYQYFEGGLGSRRRAAAAASALKRPTSSASPLSCIGPPTKVSGVGDSCHTCRNRVFLLERLIVDGRLYHRSCFRCSRCDAILNPGAYNECEHAPGTYECTVCPKDEGPEFVLPDKRTADAPVQSPPQAPVHAVPTKPEIPEKKLELTESVRAARKLFQNAMVTNDGGAAPAATNGAVPVTLKSTPIGTPDTTPDVTPNAARKLVARPWALTSVVSPDQTPRNGVEGSRTKDSLHQDEAVKKTGEESPLARWKSIEKPELPAFLRRHDEPTVTSTVRENIKRFSQGLADDSSPGLRRSVGGGGYVSPLSQRGVDRFSRLSSETDGKKLGVSSPLRSASPGAEKRTPDSPAEEPGVAHLKAEYETPPAPQQSMLKPVLDMPVIVSEVTVGDTLPKPAPRTRTLKPGVSGNFSVATMSVESNCELHGPAEVTSASPPPLPSEPPPSLYPDDDLPPGEESDRPKLADDTPSLATENADVTHKESVLSDSDALPYSERLRGSSSPDRKPVNRASFKNDNKVDKPVEESPLSKPQVVAAELPSKAEESEPADKEQSSYPTDLNPFGESDEEEYPESLNPFGDDSEGDDAVGSPVSPGRKLSGYDESLNPFSEEDDEQDVSLSSSLSPLRRTSVPPATPSQLSSSTGTPMSQRSLNVSPMLPRTPMALPLKPSPRVRKKHAAPPPPPVQAKKRVEDGVASREKSEKDEVNRSIRRSDHEDDGGTPSKSTFGYWKRKKRPAPSVPVPVRREIKRIPLKEIQVEMEEIAAKQEELERQGREIEMQIRDRNDAEPTVEEEELIMQLFELVNEKNNLFRRQAELMYIKRSQRLEEEQVELEYQIRCIMTKPLNQKCEDDAKREEELLQRLLEVVEARNEIVDSQEMDRRRVMQEDWSIQEQMAQKQSEIKEKMVTPKVTPEKKHKKKDKQKKSKSEKKALDKKASDKKADKRDDVGDEEKRKSLKKMFKEKLVLSK
ncbi:MICAL-like protein isoform X2 [Amblyomma americanum]